MEFFGLDIGSYSLKVAQVKREKTGTLRLLALGRVPSPPKGLLSEAEADLVEVAGAIKKLLSEAKISTRNVVAALPEAQTAAKTITVPKMNEDELLGALKFEAEALVPFPIEEANLDFQITSTNQNQMEVLLVAAPKRLAEKYLKIFSLAGLNPLALETEMIALVRAIVPAEFPPCLLIDFGAKTCDLGVVTKGTIRLVRSIPTAGEAFTRALATTLALEEPQAEEYKKTFGLTEEFEGKIQQSLLPILEVVTAEMRKAVQFASQEEGKTIKKVILSGGSAGLPAMATVLTQKLGLEVAIADPFTRLVFERKDFSLAQEGAIFSVALGLAEREI
jgi:type IV pilus assembly protein PilM